MILTIFIDLHGILNGCQIYQYSYSILICFYCKRYARPAEANWRLGRPSEGLRKACRVVFWEALGRLCGVLGGLLGALGRLWGAYGRLVGPKWPPRWAQVAAKWPQEPPRGRQKAAKRWFLEPKNGPKRFQRAIKRGIRKQMPKTSKLMTLSMKMLDFEVWKGLKISQNWSWEPV